MPPRRKKSIGGRAFTVEFEPLPVDKRGDAWWMEADGRELRLSNLDKIFWPDEGYTKGDLIAYYFNVAELILPHLRDRPLTMKRMPDGMDGPFFYEKTAPSHTPDWIERCPVESEDAKVRDRLPDGERPLDAPVRSEPRLHRDAPAALALRASARRTTYSSTSTRWARASRTSAVSLHVHAALNALGLTGYPKTSGATGVQIYVPVERGWSYDQVRDFVGTLGRTIERADPTA